jgi:hypothetical protein
MLNKVYRSGIDTTRRQVGEGVLRKIPEIVKLNVETVIAMKTINDQFYKDNEDLKPYKKVVAAAFEGVMSEHSDWKVEDMMKETEKVARGTLELHKVVQKKDVKKPSLPPGSKGNRQSRQKPQTSQLLDDIDAMNKDL